MTINLYFRKARGSTISNITFGGPVTRSTFRWSTRPDQTRSDFHLADLILELGVGVKPLYEQVCAQRSYKLVIWLTKRWKCQTVTEIDYMFVLNRRREGLFSQCVKNNCFGSNSFLFNISSPGTVCPSPSLPVSGDTCTLSGGLDCPYEPHNHIFGVIADCCCGQCANDVTCDSTGSTWQPTHSTLCPSEGCGSQGD